jgi:hypothetical protein
MVIDVEAGRLIKILAAMANESRAALSFGAQDDEERTRQAIDNLRGLHAKLQTIDNSVRERLEKLPESTQIPIHQNVEDIKQAENFISAWNKRYKELVAFEILVATAAGRQRVLDYVLPAEWDFARDIYVVTRASDQCFIPELVARGQIRILAIGMEKDEKYDTESKVAYTKNDTEIKQYFQKLGSAQASRLSTISHNDTSDDGKLWGVVTHAFTMLESNKATIETFGNTWLTQGLQNMKKIACGMNMAAIKDQLKELPVVIVSPGPSLDKNIHLLHQLKGRAIIMAAAQCAKALHKIGVVPDFIVIADPGKLVYFLDGVDISEVGALIAGVSCHPEFYEKPFNQIISFNANAQIDRWISNVFNDTIEMTSAGSVSIDCFLLAKYLEASAIIMVGLDLALSGGATYSSQSANSESVAEVDEQRQTIRFSNVSPDMEQVFLDKGASSKDTVEKLHTLPGYHGGTVLTRSNYYLFYNEFVELARKEAVLAKPTPIINSTEGGAYVEGFQHIPLSEAAEKYGTNESINVPMRLEKSKNNIDPQWREKQYLDFKIKVQKELNEVKRKINQCRKLSMKSTRSEKAFSALNKTEKALIQQLGNLPFISLPNFGMTQQVVQISNDARSVSETNDVASILYDAIEKTANEVLEILDK